MVLLFASAIAWETNQLLREDNKINIPPSIYTGSDYIYRAFHNVLRDYKHLEQENQRTYLNGIVHSHSKTEKKLFYNQRLSMCVPRVTRHTSIRYSSSRHTRVNMGASIFFTDAMIRAFRSAKSRGNGGKIPGL